MSLRSARAQVKNALVRIALAQGESPTDAERIAEANLTTIEMSCWSNAADHYLKMAALFEHDLARR